MGIRQKLGERIKAAREELGVTQQVLADTLSINRAVISDWETGKTSPNLDRMDVLAAFLRKPMSYFFTEATEMEGHRVKNPAFYVRAYNKTIKRLREMELEQRRQARGMATLRKHFASQATLLMDKLTPEERGAIEKEELDSQVIDIGLWDEDEPYRAGARESHASQAFATINALPRLMDEVELDGMDDERSLVSLLRAFLTGDGKHCTGLALDKTLEAEATRIAQEIDAYGKNVLPLALRLLSRIDVALRASKRKARPTYGVEKVLEAARAVAYGEAVPDSPAGSLAEEYGTLEPDDIQRLGPVVEYWARLNEHSYLLGIPF